MAAIFCPVLYFPGCFIRVCLDSGGYRHRLGLINFGMYPTFIFSKGLQTVITLIIPLAILGFMPAAALLGRPAAGTLGSVAVSIGMGCKKNIPAQVGEM